MYLTQNFLQWQPKLFDQNLLVIHWNKCSTPAGDLLMYWLKWGTATKHLHLQIKIGSSTNAELFLIIKRAKSWCHDVLLKASVAACFLFSFCWRIEPSTCMMSEWISWSACSVSCGMGMRSRERYVKQYPEDGSLCQLQTEETEKCVVNDECCKSFFVYFCFPLLLINQQVF